MNIEYKKDLRHNYMVIESENSFQPEAYCIKMLEEQRIMGVLSLEQRFMDNRTLYYYDITGKQCVSSIFEKAALSYNKIRSLLSGILAALEKAYEYLLPEDDFILTPDIIYLEVVSFTPELCFLSGYKKEIKSQLSTLLEYLMNKVDYNDKAAVLLVYQLYAASKEDGFTLCQLIEIINNQSKEGLPQSRDMRQNKAITQEGGLSPREDLSQTGYFPHKGELPQSREPLKKKELANTDQSGEKLINSAKAAFKIKKVSEITHQETKLQNQNKQSLEGIPVMPERVEQEQEVAVYPWTIYLLTGICGMIGILIIILSFTTRIVYNSFGNRIEYDKLIALILMITCIEAYIIRKLWDKKNKLVKIVTKTEYFDPRDEKESPVKAYHNMLKEPLGEENRTNQKFAIRQESILGNRAQVTPEQYQAEEEDNPTCLLTPVESNTSSKDKLILQSMEENSYQSIPITEFPFFIGKLKKNVDYCLENDVISRYHAKITREGESYFLTDLNSKNGTFVNQEALQIYEPKEIWFEDEIAFANIQYKLKQITPFNSINERNEKK